MLFGQFQEAWPQKQFGYYILIQQQKLLQQICVIEQMLKLICTKEIRSMIKMHIVAILFLVALILPYLKIAAHKENSIQMQKFKQKISDGPLPNQAEIPFEEFLLFLSKNPYQGTWLSSIKESKLLGQQNGTIQIKSSLKSPNEISDGYKIKIKIFDGSYRDGGDYEIILDSSSSIRTQQQFIANHLIYQTTSPMIGLSKHQKIFNTQKQKRIYILTSAIYINKLKFRINLNETLKIQLLLAAQYEINIITEGLQQIWQFTHQIIFSILIFIQVILQGLGSYWLLIQAQQQSMIAKSISPTMLKLGISFDIAEIYVLCYLVYSYDMKILILPTYLLIMLILYLEPYLLSKISPTLTQQQPSQIIENNRIQNQLNLTIPQNIDQIDNLLNNPKIKPLVKVIQKNRNYLMFICSFFVFYLNNMQNYIYFVYFFVLLFPQIVRNCRIGNKVNYSMESVLAFAYPRLIPIFYTRFFGLNSLFIFEPCFIFCLTILIFSFVFSALLFIQTKYGARAILPKFLIPKSLQTKFKFFMIQDQNTTCPICSTQLSSIPSQLKSKSKIKDQIIYNKVVVTPCHHQFHAHCLQKWMESRVQCPSCTCQLPPIESSQ